MYYTTSHSEQNSKTNCGLSFTKTEPQRNHLSTKGGLIKDITSNSSQCESNSMTIWFEGSVLSWRFMVLNLCIWSISVCGIYDKYYRPELTIVFHL